MSNEQFLFIARLTFQFHTIQYISFSENGNMTVAFDDRGGNFHIETLKADGTVRTEAV